MSVVILDFGSQTTRLIARRVRELKAHSVIVPGTATAARIAQEGPTALIFSGSPRVVGEDGAPRPDPGVYRLGVPILGICYGMHLLAVDHGGRVSSQGTPSYGSDTLVRYEGALFDGMTGELPVWMSHSSSVEVVPDGWSTAASTRGNALAAIVSPDGQRMGVQFHPEVVHTPEGGRMLGNFLRAAGVA
ncbi:MAG TPA: glutamine-hydrolyzing GMP synthase, partial [Candidatus Acetothermia bacterium]|nr:glutamine-hydrolyzing GMP synthase [Candidatus Acetothermia bacterium]